MYGDKCPHNSQNLSGVQYRALFSYNFIRKQMSENKNRKFFIFLYGGQMSPQFSKIIRNSILSFDFKLFNKKVDKLRQKSKFFFWYEEQMSPQSRKFVRRSISNYFFLLVNKKRRVTQKNRKSLLSGMGGQTSPKSLKYQ